VFLREKYQPLLMSSHLIYHLTSGILRRDDMRRGWLREMVVDDETDLFSLFCWWDGWWDDGRCWLMKMVISCFEMVSIIVEDPLISDLNLYKFINYYYDVIYFHLIISHTIYHHLPTFILLLMRSNSSFNPSSFLSSWRDIENKWSI